jgi:hypothetical protein
VCTVNLRVTVNNIQVLSAAQRCFYGEFISQAIINQVRSSPKVADTVVGFKTNLESLDVSSQKSPVSNFMENCPVGADKCGQTDGLYESA